MPASASDRPAPLPGARTRSPGASSSGSGTQTACSLPASNKRARCSASLLSVFTLVPARARDLGRRRDHALNAALGELAPGPYPSARARTSRAPGVAGRRITPSPRRHRRAAETTATRPSRRQAPPPRPSWHVTSKPARTPSRRGGWLLRCDCVRRGGATRTATNPHERVAGSQPMSTAQAGRAYDPCGLASRPRTPGLALEMAAVLHRRSSRRQRRPPRQATACWGAPMIEGVESSRSSSLRRALRPR